MIKDFLNTLNLRVSVAGLAGGLLYIALLFVPFLPGGTDFAMGILFILSTVTGLYIIRHSRDVADLSSILLLPLAAVITLVVFIIQSAATVNILRLSLNLIGPAVIGVIAAFVLDKILEHVDFKVEA